jgi:thymidylate synthase (FAD)
MLNVEYLSHLGDDLSIVNAARVSMAKRHSEFDEDTDLRLLRYLAQHQHWTPFASVCLSVRVTAPVFVSRQMEKHIAGLVMGTAAPARNEVSRRYVDSEPQFYSPDRWRGRPEENIKQGSGEVIEDASYLHWLYQTGLRAAQTAYRELLVRGVAPEMARMVLPQSMLTEWIWTGSLAAFHRVYGLRIDAHAQEESQVIAEQLGVICNERFPRAWMVLNGG